MSLQGQYTLQSPYLYTFKEPRNRLHGIDSVRLCSLAGRYVKYGCRTGPPDWESIHVPLKSLQIRALQSSNLET